MWRFIFRHTDSLCILRWHFESTFSITVHCRVHKSNQKWDAGCIDSSPLSTFALTFYSNRLSLSSAEKCCCPQEIYPPAATQQRTLFQFSVPVKCSYFLAEWTRRQQVSLATVTFASLWCICALQVHCFEGLCTLQSLPSLKNVFHLFLHLKVRPSLYVTWVMSRV